MMKRKSKKTFCLRCYDTDPNCRDCKPTHFDVIMNQIDSEHERMKFLAELWLKARKYLQSTISEKIDKVVIAEFGPWMHPGVTNERSRAEVPDSIKVLNLKGI